MSAIKSLAKSIAKKFIYPAGSVATIKRGPLSGCQYRLSEATGWAAIWGGWETEAQALYGSIIKPGDVVFDLGANVGLHSLLFSKLSSPNGTVVAFEPIESNVCEIKELISLNSANSIRIEQCAVSDSTGETVFHLGNHDKQGSIDGIGCESGTTITVKKVTLSDFIEKSKLKPHFIKIDIEGAEGAALHGLKPAMQLCSPKLAIDLHTPEQDVRVGKFLLEHHYVAFRILQGLRNRKPCLEVISDLSKGWPNVNGIWGTIIALPENDTEILKQLIELTQWASVRLTST